jgi:hypothetical protein
MAESTEPVCNNVVFARYMFYVEVERLGIQFPSLDLVFGTGVHESQISVVGAKSEVYVP